MGLNGINGLKLSAVCRHGVRRDMGPCKSCAAYARNPEADPELQHDATAPSAAWSPYPIGKLEAA